MTHIRVVLVLLSWQSAGAQEVRRDMVRRKHQASKHAASSIIVESDATMHTIRDHATVNRTHGEIVVGRVGRDDQGQHVSMEIHSHEEFQPYVRVTLETGVSPWYPICGHFFWDNNNGAKEACRLAGFTDGQLGADRGGWESNVREDFTSPVFEDAIPVGTCGYHETLDLCHFSVPGGQYDAGRGSDWLNFLQTRETESGRSHAVQQCTRRSFVEGNPWGVAVQSVAETSQGPVTSHGPVAETVQNGPRAPGVRIKCWGHASGAPSVPSDD